MDKEPVLTTIEPIEKSKIALALPLGMMLLSLDGLALLFGFGVYSLFPDAGLVIPAVFFIVEIIKSLAALYFLIGFLLTWESQTYYISGHHFIERSGIVSINERIYELKNIRKVEIEQNWLSQILNYGTLIVIFSVGSNLQTVRIPGVAAPRNYGVLLERYLGLPSDKGT